jgi:hypothetical protein
MKQFVVDLNDGGSMELVCEDEASAKKEANQLLEAFFDPSVKIVGIRSATKGKHRKSPA